MLYRWNKNWIVYCAFGLLKLQTPSWAYEDIKITKKEYKDSFTKYLKANNIFADMHEFLCSKLKSIEDDIDPNTKKAYKDSYINMTKIRNRNVFYDIVKEDKVIATDIKEYEKKYYHYYEENILKFEDFNNFWNVIEGRSCQYCGVKETQIDNLNIQTKRFYSRGSTMEIDKIDADCEYKKDNIILSCYWCNNAKTDEFELSEFKCIAKGIHTIWEKRLKEKDSTARIKFPLETYAESKDKCE